MSWSLGKGHGHELELCLKLKHEGTYSDKLWQPLYVHMT